jgi:uncharacterized membrane protein
MATKMATKYDTNPLDPEFPKKVRAEAQTEVLPDANKETVKFPPQVDEEEPTRIHEPGKFAGYSSVFNGTQPLSSHQTAQPLFQTDTKRKVEKIGLPENILVALPYLPFSVGLIAGLLELLFVPKSETKVRFHAAQGLAAHIGILIVTTILGGMARATDLAGAANGIFWLVTTVMLIVFAVKAWKGKPVHIESVESLTEWLEEKIKPQS